jgi:mRNA interferase ChpB
MGRNSIGIDIVPEYCERVKQQLRPVSMAYAQQINQFTCEFAQAFCIVHLEFDPAAGHEMKGSHFGLVVSPKAFNRLGLALICPIFQGAAAATRTYGTVVTLMGCGTDTQGAVHCHQVKSLDWAVRRARLRETVPDFVMDEVLARLEAILFG